MGKYEKLMGKKSKDKANVQSLANKTTDGNVEQLAGKMNAFFVSVSGHLPRLDRNNEAFELYGQLPDECHRFNHHSTSPKKSQDKQSHWVTGLDNVHAWILNNHANILAGPLTAIFNSSLREGIIPETWKSATVIPVPKVNPPNTMSDRSLSLKSLQKHCSR